MPIRMASPTVSVARLNRKPLKSGLEVNGSHLQKKVSWKKAMSVLLLQEVDRLNVAYDNLEGQFYHENNL